MKYFTLVFTLLAFTICCSKAQRSNLIIGQKVPEFALVDNNGKKVKLSDFEGKLILIDFWASYCGPCRQQSKTFFKPLYEKLQNTKFEILGISIDKDKSKWIDAIKEDGNSWLQVCLALNTNSVQKDYGVFTLPTVMLIDENGNLLGRDMPKYELIETIHEKIDQNSSIILNELYDATKSYKDWEEFLEDLIYDIDKYVYENTNYPEAAKKNGITGSIPVMLTIGTDFKIELLTFLKSVPGTKGKEKVKILGHGCEDEVKRVIESMKNWKSFPYVRNEHTYSNAIFFHFPPKEPVRKEIKISQ